MKSAAENSTRSSKESKFTTSAASGVEGNARSASQPGWWMVVAAVAFVCFAATMSAHAQTFTVLWNLSGLGDSGLPQSLVQGFDGNFYGTTVEGAGTVFRITPDGALATIYHFCSLPKCADGSGPSGLLLGTDGNFYGTTGGGGKSEGTIFKITPDGVLQTLHLFIGGPGGAQPAAALAQGADGNYYGTTLWGGTGAYAPPKTGYGGTVFKITPQGTFTRLYSFCSQADCADGAYPDARLIAANGKLYGTTEALGGSSCPGANGYGCGTVFSITLAGSLTVLHRFNGTDGDGPTGTLVEGPDGAFYGTTSTGGTHTCYTEGCGTIFKITPSGSFFTLHDFTGGSDGSNPFAGLMQGSDGDFYAMADAGADMNAGTIFKITPSGELTTLFSFGSGGGGYYAGSKDLAEGTDGILYGTTDGGNASHNFGCVFSFNVGFHPFVEPVPALGKAGTTVTILGTDLTGATSVTFNGTPATFTVVSASEITTTVPAGATSGKIRVTTPSGTLATRMGFLVTQ